MYRYDTKPKHCIHFTMNILGVGTDCILNNLPFYGEAHSLCVSLVDTLACSSSEDEREQAIEDLNHIIAEHVTVALALQEIVKQYSVGGEEVDRAFVA